MIDLARYQRSVIDLLFRDDPEPHLAALTSGSAGSAGDVATAGEAGDVERARWRVYRRMTRTRLAEVIDHAFPRFAAVFTPPRWEAMTARFFDEAPPRSPYLRDVPGEMTAWLTRRFPDFAEASGAPPWAVDLAAVEWALLDAGYRGEEEGAREARVGELSMDAPAVLTPAMRLVHVGWSVHRIPLPAPPDPEGPDSEHSEHGEHGENGEHGDEGDEAGGAYAVVEAGAWALCLYRDPRTHAVRTLELTPFVADLLEEVQRAAHDDRPLADVVRMVAARRRATIDAPFVVELSELLADLVERGVWIGSRA